MPIAEAQIQGGPRGGGTSEFGRNSAAQPQTHWKCVVFISVVRAISAIVEVTDNFWISAPVLNSIVRGATQMNVAYKFILHHIPVLYAIVSCDDRGTAAAMLRVGLEGGTPAAQFGVASTMLACDLFWRCASKIIIWNDSVSIFKVPSPPSSSRATPPAGASTSASHVSKGYNTLYVLHLRASSNSITSSTSRRR